MPKFENSQSSAERDNNEGRKDSHEEFIKKDKRIRREFIILDEGGTDDLESWIKLKGEPTLFNDKIKDPELKEELRKNRGSYYLSHSGDESHAWIEGDLRYVDRNGNLVHVGMDLKKIVEFVESGLSPLEQWKKVENKLHEWGFQSADPKDEESWKAYWDLWGKIQKSEKEHQEELKKEKVKKTKESFTF